MVYEEQFPQELKQALSSTFNAYRAIGWTEIDVGWPTASLAPGSTVFVHATSPSGERVHGEFEDDERLINNIDNFLKNCS